MTFRLGSVGSAELQLLAAVIKYQKTMFTSSVGALHTKSLFLLFVIHYLYMGDNLHALQMVHTVCMMKNLKRLLIEISPLMSH